MQIKILAVVPAYNEQDNIQTAIEDLRHHQPEMKIVVINDRSTDQTEEVVRELGETVINLPVNLGIGGAVQTGLKYAREYGYDMAIQFDGDGQHIAAEIATILEPILNDEADVVIGSRFLGTSEFQSSFLRRIGIDIFMLINSLLIGRKITDNTSGFRAYKREAIAFLAHFYPQDYPEPEAVIELYRNKFRITEVPVQMRKRAAGASSIGAIGSLYYMIKVLLASLIAFSRKPVVKEN